ncbi:MAG: NAD-dependent epimerase/dehydratase family protein, partial [Plesiomonas shigelloides]
MKVVIIGASGTIGRAVQQLLLQQQHEVIGVR